MEQLFTDINGLIFTVVILIICGVVAGFLAGLLGIGGGVIFVPVLYFVFMSFFHVPADVAIVLATGTSLMCMIPTSISAAISQYKRGNTDLNIIKSWSPYMFIGVVVGSVIAAFYGGQWLAILFGVVMIINSINTLFQKIIAFSIACFSVMLGIGGGTLTVPILNACNVEPHKSIGTSSAVSLFVCIPGVIVLLATSTTPQLAPIGTFGFVNILAALCVIPSSVLIAPFGVKIGKNVSPVTLKRIFAIALFIISLRMLYSALF